MRPLPRSPRTGSGSPTSCLMSLLHKWDFSGFTVPQGVSCWIMFTYSLSFFIYYLHREIFLFFFLKICSCSWHCRLRESRVTVRFLARAMEGCLPLSTVRDSGLRGDWPFPFPAQRPVRENLLWGRAVAKAVTLRPCPVGTLTEGRTWCENCSYFHLSHCGSRYGGDCAQL